MKQRLQLLILLFSALTVLILVPTSLTAQAFKLYLKDGSYQLVKEYQIQGDRVRYYSVERSTWEEIPAALVDFDATRKAQAEEKTVRQKNVDEAKEISKTRFEKPKESSFQVSPGIHLPEGEGVFAFDGERIVPLGQATGTFARDKKRMALNLAIPAPLLKSRSLVVIPGNKAPARFRQARPTFYARFADGSGARMQLIALKTGKADRVMEDVDKGMVGKATELRKTIPVTITQPSPGVYALQPQQDLQPGEYALGEILNDGRLNLDVWDFGIDPQFITPGKKK
jgi:hypothetical protein